MIPLRDDNPTTIQPFVTVALIAASTLVFLWQLTLGEKSLEAAIYGLGRDEIYHPSRNIHVGVKYLKYLMNKFKKEHLVVAAYNAGESAVRRYNGIPPYAETRTYVRRVLHYSKIYSG